jgi:adenylate cyclase
MAEAPSRKLAVLLHADVVGSTTLVQKNESIAHERILTTFARLSKTILDYGGTAHEIRGDALVAEFSRASDAVCGALQFQTDNIECNGDLADDIQPEVRIGISLGEVVVADGTITGAGVVLAQRLEQLAESNGVVVQATVSETVPTRLPFDFESLGEQTLKGFDQPVRAFNARVSAGATIPRPESLGIERERREDTGEATEQPKLDRLEKPSVAVLPFNNMSGDPEQEYFAHGIAEDIITDLSKFPGLFVVARNSSFAYQGKSLDVRKIAEELGVRFVLEGSVRKAGERVRITAQLVDGTTGGHSWADRYDRDLDDVFLVQDEVRRSVVEALQVELTPDRQTELGSQNTPNVEAYDFMLRGRELAYRHTPEASIEAQAWLEKSIETDPEFSAPHAWLAVVLFTDYASGWTAEPQETLQRGLRGAEKAVAIDASDAIARLALARAYMWSRDLDRAMVECSEAVRLNPNYADGYAVRGYILSYAGEPADSIQSFGEAMRLNPQYPSFYLHFLGLDHFLLGEYEEAAVLLKQRIRIHSETDVSRVLLASCYGHLDRILDAQKMWDEALTVNPNFSLEQRAKVLPFKNPADWDRIVEGLRKAAILK